MIITHDGPVDIAVGKWRKEKRWQNKNVAWSALVNKLSTTTRTPEKHAEYMAMSKARQDEVKDIGGFVGGYLTNGRRLNGNVQHRQLVTLDIDFAEGDVWADFQLIYECAAVMYSTHKHSPDKPRLRLVLPLDREVFADEYVAIARRIAGTLGIEQFDDTTYQPERLMYWPSTSEDAEYYFEAQDGEWLRADDVLSSYHNWKDSSEWPVSVRHKDAVKRSADKQGDPLEKPGIIGAFCRTYSIADVIERFLADVYEPCDVDGRYTYKHGSTSGGLVVYDDKFAYSHHGTDPVSGKLCNAFDLVRLHLFGLKDDGAAEGTKPQNLSSFKAMQEFCTNDKEVRRLIVTEKLDDAKEAFSGVGGPGAEKENPRESLSGQAGSGLQPGTEESEAAPLPDADTWKEHLEIDKKGNIQSTIDNIVLVLENDPKLAGALAWDEFEQRPIVRRSLPWRKISERNRVDHYLRDTDDDNLAHYMERTYDIGASKIKTALGVIFERHRIHPVRDYLKGLRWDGVPRVETLLIEYLGAEDNEYVRAVTRKQLAAAVARVMHPGCKFDTVLVLVGRQGDKKSTLVSKLGGKWFSDSFTTVQGKEAFEQLQGAWLVEIAELAGFRRAEVETVKHFVSKGEDRYRAAYGHHLQNYPRQCVFFASTNKTFFLQDATGGRRFWPVETDRKKATKDPYDMTAEERDQLWAEAVELWAGGEKLYLEDALLETAEELQDDHTDIDPRTNAVRQYLETLLPDGWEDMALWDRRAFLQGQSDQLIGTRKRTRVTVGELWAECFGNKPGDMTKYNTGDVHDIMIKMPGWERSFSKLAGKYGKQRFYQRKAEVGVVLISHVPER